MKSTQVLELKESSSVWRSFSIFIQETHLKWDYQWNKELRWVIATQSDDIPTKVIKSNYGTFAISITENFTDMIGHSFSQFHLNKPRILHIFSKIYEHWSVNLWAYKLWSALTLFFLNTNLDLERDIMHSNLYLLWLKPRTNIKK